MSVFGLRRGGREFCHDTHMEHASYNKETGTKANP